MCNSKTPATQNPGAAPPPTEDPAAAPVVDGGAASAENLLNAKRAGRKSLRIDLASAVPTGGTGLNIPV